MSVLVPKRENGMHLMQTRPPGSFPNPLNVGCSRFSVYYLLLPVHVEAGRWEKVEEEPRMITAEYKSGVWNNSESKRRRGKRITASSPWVELNV
jgi:hypothetical protein